MSALQIEADIAISPLAMTVSRQKAIAYSTPCLTTNLVIVGSSPSPEITNIAGLFMVFDLAVWLALLASMILLVWVSGFRVYHHAKQSSLLRGNLDDYYFLMTCYVSALLLEGTPRSPPRQGGRFLYGIWWLVMLVLANAFCGHFRAMMMVQRQGERIRNVQHLSTVTDRVLPVIMKNSAYEYYFRLGMSMEQRRIWVAISRSERSLNIYSKDVLLKMAQGKAVIINEYYTTKYEIGRRCELLDIGDLYFAQEPFLLHHVAFGYRKGLDPTLIREINKRVRWMNEAHVGMRTFVKEVESFDKCAGRSSTYESQKALTMEDMSGIFFIWLGCLAVAAFGFLMEELIFWAKKRKASTAF